MPNFLISSGPAATIVLANALASKLYMTFMFRSKMVLAKDKNAIAKIKESDSFKRIHAAQLNDAEYSPVFLAILLFLSLKQVDAPWPSTLAAFGCPFYFWGHVTIGFPYTSIGATARYISLVGLAYELYKIFF
jgi:hypothetical protein